MIYLKTSLFFLLAFVFHFTSFSQEKYESEKRITAQKVPAKSLNFIRSFAQNKKVRWYLEESLHTKSIEAKFKKNKRKFSVEFTTDGTLEDIEVSQKKGELPKNTMQTIKQQLSSNCSSFKIRKIQAQFLNITTKNKKVTPEKLLATKPNNFEIVLSCKKNRKLNLYEYLFSYTGTLVSKTRIISKNAINLEY